MSNISINSGSTESAVAQLVQKIQSGIIDAGKTSSDAIVNAVEDSAGDFIDALREEVAQEAEVISTVGELLIAMAQYIQTAAAAFASVDAAYNSSKV